jgi:hypothetical protein
MAFSLEAAMTLPVSMAVWIGFMAAAAPAYEKEYHIAGLSAETTFYSLENQHLYRTSRFEAGDAASTGLQVSPQEILEIWSLARDDAAMIRQAILPGESADESPGDGGRP